MTKANADKALTETVADFLKFLVTTYDPEYFIRKAIHCPKCGHQHIDLDEEVEVVIDGVEQGRFKNFGVEPHRNHTCLNCLHTFPDFDNEKSIGV